LKRRAPGRWTAITVEAPAGLPEAFLAGTWLPYGNLWIPHLGMAFATAGVARRILVRGKDRVSQLRTELQETFARLDVVAEVPSAPAPRFFGGLAFAEGAADEPPWEEFGDGAFVLPRWTYSILGEEAYLTFIVGPDERSRLAALLDEYDTVLASVAGTGISMWAPTIKASDVGQLPVDTWKKMLADVRGRLGRGELAKVVMARRSDVPIPPKLKDVTMLVRLRREIPECTRFAFRGEHATFLGATPELLFSKTKGAVLTEALAGSIRCVGTDVHRLNEQNQKLLQSEKDLKEHAFVVNQIRSRLDVFFAQPGAPPPPSTRRFRNIIHLHTPIGGELASDVDALTLLEALHPTPAVGGVPPLDAAQCIVDVEPCRRGWYAGPVGWIDCRGDANFCVGIRSCLLAHPTAYVYAGAGIVAESDPLAEYSETGLKQMPMLLALGVDSVTLRATIAPHSRPEDA
jgi:menaquinone-specific isochorismate synthase